MKSGEAAIKKIWIEALTPKQALLFSLLAKELENTYRLLITTRRYDFVTEIFENKGLKPLEIGKYGGRTLEEKWSNSLKRMEKLTEVVSREKPDLHVTFMSPDSARVSFGLGIPVVSMSDSPHSAAVSRLVIPLSRVFLTPKFIEDKFSAYSRLTRILAMNSVFEAAWVIRLRKDRDRAEELGLSPMNYIIVRPPEEKSYYYPGSVKSSVRRFIVGLLKKIFEETDYKVLIYIRYPDQKEYFKIELQGFKKRYVFLEKATDMPSLEFYARLVVTGGATMATESALLGTPAVYIFPKKLEVLDYLSRRGYPLYHMTELTSSSIKQIVSLSKQDISEEEKEETLEKTRKSFEDPISKIKKALNIALTVEA